jgi:hypothetical protein
MMKKIIFIMFVLVVCGGGVFAAYKYFAPTTSAPVDQSGAIAGTDFAKYDDQMFHFQLNYPKDLEVHVYDEDDGARTITFEGATPGIGFQVFVVPYTNAVITDERFKTDDPSGVMQDPQDIKIVDVPAKIFYGHNDSMGDTREVWFIKDGYLYEVTTYKALDSWLSDIMLTWQFI